MKIGYIVNQYPSISLTFVRREMQALERLGADLVRYAIRTPPTGAIAPEDREESGRTRVILKTAKPALVLAMARTFFARPFTSIGVVRDALAMGAVSESGLFRHLMYAAEALILADWLKRDGIDHLHAHFGTNSATVAMLAARLARTPFSFTVHGPEEFDKPRLISLARKIEESAFVAGVSSFGVSQMRRLVAPAHWPKLHIIRCGIEKDFYEGASGGPPAHPRRFVSIGRLSEQKGQLTLVEAAARLAAGGEKDFDVVIVGDGPMRGDLEAAIAEAGLGRRFHLVGWKSPAEVRAAILDGGVFVLPSYAEGLPVSIMEAFSLARPVIATYIAGIPELVAPGRNGWLAPAGNADALADAMKEALAASAETRAAFAADGKARVMARHDIDHEAARLLGLFRRSAGAGDAVGEASFEASCEASGELAGDV